MYSKEDESLIQEKAEEAAKKICARGCLAGYESCKKPQHAKEDGEPNIGISLNAPDIGCPLAKYEIPDAPVKSFFERIGSEPNRNDCFYLCMNCEHAATEVMDERMSVYWPNFERSCIDCPVQMIREIISEAEAEAAMA